MKKAFTLLTILLLAFNSIAQTPELMSYQAVIRNNSNELISNESIGMRIQILKGSIFGSAVYVETQNPTTNINGLVTVQIGAGTIVSGDFSAINWGDDTYFIKTETDPSGGANYSITGTSQLLSVPYALHAKTADSLVNGINETDPIYSSSVASNITTNDTMLWGSHTIDTDTHIDSVGISSYGYMAGAHTIDTDTHIDSVGISNYGYVSGLHTVDTQLDSLGVASLGYVAGAHTIDTDTQIDSIGITNYGFVAGSHIQLDSVGIANYGFVSGAHTVDTQIDSVGITNYGFVSGAHTMDTQIDSAGVASLGYVAGAHTIDTDTQLDSAGVASLGYVAGAHTIDTDTHIDSVGISNYGYVDGAHTVEVDGDTTNEIQGLTSVLGEGNDATGIRIINLGQPVQAQDAVTKAYVDLLEARIDSLITSFNPLTIQQRLNNGETPFQIYQGNNGLLSQIYGNTYQGGLIFDLDTANGDGLICAPFDQHFSISATGAVTLCAGLVLNGYSDWFLPSSTQLVKLKDNIAIFTGNGFTTGGYYWSSTQVVSGNYNSYYVLRILPGANPSGSVYYSGYRARAIRSF